MTKVDKVVDGNKFATMIAQDENNVNIIAKKMKVSGDMVVNGAITAEKLDIKNLSALNSNLGSIKSGSLLLQKEYGAGSGYDEWGGYKRPKYKQGTFINNNGLITSGRIQRLRKNAGTANYQPVVKVKAGQLLFSIQDFPNDLEGTLTEEYSGPNAKLFFDVDKEEKQRFTLSSSGYINFSSSNYTSWQSTGVAGCEYMIQGRLVVVNYDVTFNSAGNHTIGGIPQEFTKKTLMMTAKAWSILPNGDRNIQLNPDGGMHILNAEANVNYRGTLVFGY